MIDKIVDILKNIKLTPTRMESDVVDEIIKLLTKRRISYKKEFKISPRCRVDLLIEDGIVVEVKKGKPNSRMVAEQVRRYAESDKVTAVILVSERGLVRHIDEANGKPMRYVALSKNWGLTT